LTSKNTLQKHNIDVLH